MSAKPTSKLLHEVLATAKRECGFPVKEAGIGRLLWLSWHCGQRMIKVELIPSERRYKRRNVVVCTASTCSQVYML